MNELPHINCRQAIEQLWAYIDGELPEIEAGRVHDHLDACASCYPHYDFQRAFCAFLHNLPSRQTPPGLRRKIFLRLLEEESGEPFPTD
jgi:mycothiol system anti-sigma-R factor